MFEHGRSDYDPEGFGRSEAVGVSAGEIKRQSVPELFALNDGGEVGEAYSCQSNIRTMLESMVSGALRQGKTLSMYISEDGKIPISNMKLPDGSTLLKQAREIYPEYVGNRSALNAYLLRSSACYIETKKTSKNYKTGMVTPSLDKRVLTTNIDIARSWAGEAGVRPAVEKKLADVDEVVEPVISDGSSWDDDPSYEMTAVPVVKLDGDRSGARKVVNTRDPYMLSSKDEIMPLFVYRAMVDEIYSQAQDKAIRVSYRRTSGEVRTMDITFNKDMIAGIYGEEMAEDALAASYNGSFDDWPTVYSGYVRVPSIGESRYDGIERSLNFASIFEVQFEGIEPDLMFVNIEINKVISMFYASASSMMITGQFDEYSNLSSALREFGISDGMLPGEPDSLEGWLNRKDIIEGTGFRKRLAEFMLMTPNWFPEFAKSNTLDYKPIHVEEDDSVGIL